MKFACMVDNEPLFYDERENHIYKSLIEAQFHIHDFLQSDSPGKHFFIPGFKYVVDESFYFIVAIEEVVALELKEAV